MPKILGFVDSDNLTLYCKLRPVDKLYTLLKIQAEFWLVQGIDTILISEKNYEFISELVDFVATYGL